MINKFLSLPDSIKQPLMLSAAFLVGAAVGRCTLPAKIVTKTETKIVQQEVKAENKAITTKRNVDTTVTTKPDGTRVVETKDLSVVTDILAEKDQTKVQSDHIDEKTVTYSKPSWMLGIGAGIHATSLKDGAIYSAQIQKRMLGPIWIGGSAQTDGFMGLSVHLEF
jgi:hypothetical protein